MIKRESEDRKKVKRKAVGDRKLNLERKE